MPDDRYYTAGIHSDGCACFSFGEQARHVLLLESDGVRLPRDAALQQLQLNLIDQHVFPLLPGMTPQVGTASGRLTFAPLHDAACGYGLWVSCRCSPA